MSQGRIILASASPRRRDLLALVGIRFEAVATNIDESVLPGEVPHEHAERLAREKALAAGAQDGNAVVIGADTIVVIDDTIIGKPVSADDAAGKLRLLSGRTHSVYSAVAVLRGKTLRSSVEHVSVTFRSLDQGEIDAYIATGEPMDKAGAYGIQGFGATIVERVDGDYFAVMGLPLVRMVRLLSELGVRYEFERGLTLDP